MMLSRTASSLFWMGRYLERTENIARFIKISVHSSVDTTFHDKKQYMYRSILANMGLDKVFEFPPEGIQDSAAFFHYIVADLNNYSSLRYGVQAARENARSIRDSISSELWNYLNVFYHLINKYEKKKLTTNELIDVCELVNKYCALIFSKIETTILQNETSHFLHLGIHIERAAQVVRTIYAKTHSADYLSVKVSDVNFEYMNMLRAEQGLDMSKKVYRGLPTPIQALEFLILNEAFPRSILFNLRAVVKHIGLLSYTDKFEKDSLEFLGGKIANQLTFTSINDITNLELFLDETLENIYQLSKLIELKYMS